MLIFDKYQHTDLAMNDVFSSCSPCHAVLHLPVSPSFMTASTTSLLLAAELKTVIHFNNFIGYRFSYQLARADPEQEICVLYSGQLFTNKYNKPSSEVCTLHFLNYICMVPSCQLLNQLAN